MLHWDNSNGSFNPTEDMATTDKDGNAVRAKFMISAVSQRTDRIHVVILKNQQLFYRTNIRISCVSSIEF